MIGALMNRPGPWRKQRAILYYRVGGFVARFRKPARDYLEARTQKDAAWWVEFIQRAIAESFVDSGVST